MNPQNPQHKKRDREFSHTIKKEFCAPLKRVSTIHKKGGAVSTPSQGALMPSGASQAVQCGFQCIAQGVSLPPKEAFRDSIPLRRDTDKNNRTSEPFCGEFNTKKIRVYPQNQTKKQGVEK